MNRRRYNIELDPLDLVKWWKEAETNVKLAYPHESKENQMKLIEHHFDDKLRAYRKSHKIYFPPSLEEKTVAQWYNDARISIRERFPEKTLKEREELATEIVKKKILHHKRVVPLDKFLEQENREASK
ncbi:MAG: hypothetical protein EAX86_03945 [Candidatus Heimdallarchaeota archaeon]|nr:hypothetical protein [Candidatus Heimdallarchaeota archaeon]